MNNQKHVKPNSVQDRLATDGNKLAAEHFEGPLPHPVVLERYDTIVPGSAKMIIDDYAENTSCIRDLKKRELEATIERDSRGQWMAFILGVGVLLIAGYSLYRGYPWVAGGTLFFAVAGVAGSITKMANIKK